MWQSIVDFWEGDYGWIVAGISILVLAYLLTRISRRVMGKLVRKNADSERVDPTQLRFVRNSVALLIYLMATVIIVYITPGGRGLAISLFAGAGIFAAIVGFASQAAFSNIIAGVFIVIFKPFRVDDWIMIGPDVEGTVEDITLRHTVIRDFENQRIIIPNSIISSETVINLTIVDRRTCKHIHFPIAFDADIARAKQILAEEVMRHPLWLDNRTDEDKAAGRPPVMVRVRKIQEYSLLLRAWAWAATPDDAFYMFTDLNESVILRFREEGIEIPLPQRQVVLKDPKEVLPPSGKA